MKSFWIKSFYGAALVSIMAVCSVQSGNPFVSPVILSAGVFMVLAFELRLYTTVFPIVGFDMFGFLILAVNLLSSTICGFLFGSLIKVPIVMVTDIMMAVVTGIVIGLVAVVNNLADERKFYIQFVLMYTFAYLKLPHGVVYATLAPMYCIQYGVYPWRELLVTVVGNIIGGLVVHTFVRRVAGVNCIKSIAKAEEGDKEYRARHWKEVHREDSGRSI